MKEYIITNATIKQNSFGGYMVIADSERFGEQEILFESAFIEECNQYIKDHTEHAETDEQEIKKLIESLPEEKKAVLRKALSRNAYLTSVRVLSTVDVKIYVQGAYLEFEGTRTSFKVFVDRTGAVIRKPSDKNLCKIREKTVYLDFSTFERI